ncbi:YodC family protein [Bacteroides ihuae]|uniref:YodC family protein n=1 Tax=Bacteroides ihuae TaxID=1852362 RepID=UPI0008D90801|nr:DUF2158 domain-containing protein [Bacteroides ihuae]
MENEFKTGDIVILKSGGPKMTVESIDMRYGEKDAKVLCTWFVINEKKSDRFMAGALKLYE